MVRQGLAKHTPVFPEEDQPLELVPLNLRDQTEEREVTTRIVIQALIIKSAKLDPKTAQLLTNQRSRGGRSTISYYEPLDILDDQTVFDNEGIRWNEMFELRMNNTGKVNVVQYDAIRQKIKKIGQEIVYEVFYNRYQKANVDENLSAKEVESITVKQVDKSLSFVKIYG